MPSKIQQFCGSHANSLNWQYRAAQRKISLGAIALGESHDAPHARALIFDLIEAGYVKKLFLEMASQGPQDELRSEEKLRTDFLGQDISNTLEWKLIELTLNFFEQRRNNPIPFATLILTAVKKDVSVFFFDNAVNIRERSTPEGMKTRNRTMGEVFRQYSSGTDAGSVVLIGGDHLYPVPSGGLYAFTIQGNCGIPIQNVIDLGKIKWP